jgi:hypothetical protein
MFSFADQTTREAGYDKWIGGEPNGGTAENCGLIHRHGLLANYWCYKPLPFICEFNL